MGRLWWRDRYKRIRRHLLWEQPYWFVWLRSWLCRFGLVAHFKVLTRSELYGQRLVIAGRVQKCVSWRALSLKDPCVYCGGKAATMDHIVPRAHRGANRWSNMAPSCEACNYAKGCSRVLLFLLAKQPLYARYGRPVSTPKTKSRALRKAQRQVARYLLYPDRCYRPLTYSLAGRILAAVERQKRTA